MNAIWEGIEATVSPFSKAGPSELLEMRLLLTLC